MEQKSGPYAATLTLVELGLGSLLHSLKIPFAGHFLSVNQMALLARAAFQLNSKKSALEISAIAALLKSLSPAGKKLTPMLAIAAQGLFFYLGLISGGLNSLGLFLAVVLSSAWAFIQPVLFLYILFGKTSVDVALYYLKEMEKFFPQADQFLLITVIAFYVLKCLLAFIACYVTIRMKDEAYQRYQEKMMFNIKSKSPSSAPAWKLAFKDLFNPLFLVSFVMTAIFFFFSQSDRASLIWALLRPLAVGYFLFYIFRAWPVERLPAWLRSRGYHSFADNLETALLKIKGKN